MTRYGIGRPESPGAVDQWDRGRFEADGPEIRGLWQVRPRKIPGILLRPSQMRRIRRAGRILKEKRGIIAEILAGTGTGFYVDDAFGCALL